MGLVLAAPSPFRLTWRRTPRLPASLLRIVSSLTPHLVFLITSCLLLYPALTSGAVQWEDDTKYFYYPFLATIAAALKVGRLPLWEPGIFGGYPLFADGEGGMLYPPNLIALRLLEPATALVALRFLRWYLAGAFTYAYLRAIGCTRAAAVTGGLAFMCSGFMVGQVVHENLASGMVWLPLGLYFIERSVTHYGSPRYRHAAFAGVALAMQALAVHVQVCLFTALALFPYLGWRVLWRSPLRAHVLDRIGIGFAIGLTTGLTALGLSAVQLLPLVTLAERSARGQGIALTDATINSVTPFRLLTTVFPDLMRLPDGTPFGHWVDWDVAVFVGAPTLLFAFLAAALRRDAHTSFFAVLGVSALLLSMGRYGPPWVVAVTRDLLGEHGLRSPGRFAFLWSFAIAALAGLGVDWLMRLDLRSLRGLGARLWLGAVAAASAGFLAGLLSAATAGRAWLIAYPDSAVAWLDRAYLAYDRSVRLKVTAGDAYTSLLRTLDPASPGLRLWVFSLVGGYAVFVGWCLVRSLPRPVVGRVAHGLLVACTAIVVAGPLVGAAGRAHPAQPIASVISPDSRATTLLRNTLAPVGTDSSAHPLYRSYASQAVYLGRSDAEPNTLLPFGVQEAGGYSSLNSQRHTAYAWAAETSAGRMLDVWNARYFVVPNQPHTQPSYELTSFHPERPLVSGNGKNAGAVAWFRLPSVVAENVRVIATLRDAWSAVPGEVAAWIVAEDHLGQRHEWPLRVGLELAEATVADPAMRAQRPPELAAHHSFPLTVHTGREYAADGSTFPVHLYYAALPLPDVRQVVRLGVRAVPIASAPEAILRVHGLGAGQPDWWVHNISWFDRERFVEVFADDEVRVYRNETALPRAYLVPIAAALPREHHVKHMAERAFDPERMIFVETPVAPTAPTAASVEDVSAGSWFTPFDLPPVELAPLIQIVDAAARKSRSPSGAVNIRRYSGEGVELEVSASEPAWLFLGDTFDPAWRAYVDGHEQVVHRANAMFRAIALPPGTHLVEFRYQPEPLRRGAAVSLLTGLFLVAVLLGSAALTPGRRYARRRREVRHG